MIIRGIAAKLAEFARGYPILAITGPRQSGKTTLARMVFPEKPYVNFEDPIQRGLFHSDPRGFLARFPDGGIFDEVQHCPELMSYLQVMVDADGRMGLFVLTGSQHIGMHGAVTQSLAGRVSMVELLPFSMSELQGALREPPGLDNAFYTGAYPPVIVRDVAPWRWYTDYVTTYIQRDVRQLLAVQNLDAFTTFVKLCAGHVGQLVNATNFAEACGVDAKTIKNWLSVLQASYIVFLLRSHHENFKKRLVKSQKLYFYDTGLACSLLGLTDVSQLATHPFRGALMENWVVSELLKARLQRGLLPNLFFWRNSSGLEVDILAEGPFGMMPIEIKSGQTLRPEYIKNLLAWCALAGDRARKPAVVYGGSEDMTLLGVDVFSWKSIAKLGARI